MRKLISILMAAGLIVGVVGGAGAAKVKTTKVFTDAAGDSGNVDNGPIPGFDQAGLDLVGGSVSTVGKNIRFTAEVAALSPDGRFMPETVRLLWHINAGGDEYQFTVKSFDIGKPDVAGGGAGQERIGQAYANGVVRLEACSEMATPAINLVQCETSYYTEPVFDAAKKTFSWDIPMAELKVKKGSVIAPGTSGHASTNCVVCFIPHYGERSLSPVTTIDNATITKFHKV